MDKVLFTSVNDKCTPKPSTEFPFSFDLIYHGDEDISLPCAEDISDDDYRWRYYPIQVPTGVRILLPENVCGSLSLYKDVKIKAERSGYGDKIRIPKNSRMIPAGFRGCLTIPVASESTSQLRISPNTKLAYLQLHYLPLNTLHKVNKLPHIPNFSI